MAEAVDWFEVVRQAHHERGVVGLESELEHQVNPAHGSDDYPVRTEPVEGPVHPEFIEGTEPVEGPVHPEFIEGPEPVELFEVVRQAHHERDTKCTNGIPNARTGYEMHERAAVARTGYQMHERTAVARTDRCCTNGSLLQARAACFVNRLLLPERAF